VKEETTTPRVVKTPLTVCQMTFDYHVKKRTNSMADPERDRMLMPPPSHPPYHPPDRGIDVSHESHTRKSRYVNFYKVTQRCNIRRVINQV
jgi:hypothetical protein